ncbi:hypothetical protein GTW66_08555 [Streptomyces sp. SID5473]|uniref:condensation domain-containing protein n=1 Tax=Streptomyces sp. SID5473 TaxID=2690299 RepID=UPI00025CDB0B|nr:condensation domain-containing protein [Streptomyces sp. SID5473]EIF88037.1 amino acid adenylation protein [Streptomyces tsukubensis NRRL18488]MYS64137.1 hypothetical protein [Streptomyces sp. SID5473]
MTAADTGLRELTAAQRGIWYAQQLAPDDTVLNVAEYLEIDGGADPRLFARAVRAAVADVDAYRLRFTVADGEPRQYTEPAADVPVQLVDVSAEPEPRAAAEAWMRTELRRPVDPRSGPLFALAVLVVSDDTLFWYHRAHHLILDGHGGALIAARVADAYSALLTGGRYTAEAPEPSTVLVDAEHAYRASPDRERDRAFWLDTLAGAS